MRGLAERLFQTHPMWWEPGAVPLAAREQRPRIVFRIRIGRMTGRRAEIDRPKTMPDHVVERGGSHWLTQVLRRALRRRTRRGRGRQQDGPFYCRVERLWEQVTARLN